MEPEAKGLSRPRRACNVNAGRLMTELASLWRITCAYPSTWLVPLIVLALLCGLGVFGVHSVAQTMAELSKAKAASIAGSASSALERKFAAAAAPMLLLSALVQFAPNWTDSVEWFTGVGPALLAQAPAKSVYCLELAPQGIIRASYPATSDTLNFNMLDASTPSTADKPYQEAVRERRAALTGPLPLRNGGVGAVLGLPVFIGDSGPEDSFELDGEGLRNPACGAACSYNATGRERWWGFVSAMVDVEVLVHGRDSPLLALAALGYRYRLHAPQAAHGLSDVASSGSPPCGQPVVVGVSPSAGVQWSLYLSPEGGWMPRWYGGVVAAAVVLSLIVSGLLFAVLVSRKKQQLLLEALLPKQVIAEMRTDHNHITLLASAPRVTQADTPADLLLSMMASLLEGQAPDVRDVVFIRSALLRSANLYTPLHLKQQLKGANLDTDVMAALMRQLGATHTTPDEQRRRNAQPYRTFTRGSTRGSTLLDSSTTGLSAAGEEYAPSSVRNSQAGTGEHVHVRLSLAGRADKYQWQPQQQAQHHMQHQTHQTQDQTQRQQQQLHEHTFDTLSGALAVLLSPNAVAAAVHSSPLLPPPPPLCLPPMRGAVPSPSPVALSQTLTPVAGGPQQQHLAAAVGAVALAPPAPQRELMPPQLSSAALLDCLDLASITEAEGMLSEAAGSPYACSGNGVIRKQSSSIGVTARPDAEMPGSAGGGGAPLRMSCSGVGIGGVKFSSGGFARGSPPSNAVISGFGVVAVGSLARGAGGAGLHPRHHCLSGPVLATALPLEAGAGVIHSQAGGGCGGGAVGGGSMRGARTALMGLLAAAGLGDGSRGSRHHQQPLHSVSGLQNGEGASVPPQSPLLTHAPRLPPPILEEVERLLAQADGWHFDSWQLSEATQGHALSALGFYLMQREGLIDKLRIKPVVLARLLRATEAGYLDNPYHSATHAADVLQTLHVIIHGAQLHHHYLDRLGLLAAYFAAIVHDLAHPGLTNDFLIATSDPLAVRYNDRSPLENHHAASAFELLQQPELDVIGHLPQADRAAFRKQVIEMVMGTDMKQHFTILSHFNTVHRLASYTAGSCGQQQRRSRECPTLGERSSVAATVAAVGSGSGAAAPGSASVAGAEGGEGPGGAPPMPVDEAERLLTLQVALKAADIGHLGEELPVHERWLGALEEEFFSQGDREKVLGLPISPLFDRSKQGVSKSQVGFYDFVGLPLVHAMSSAFPGATPLMSAFLKNYHHWRAVEAKSASGEP